MQYVKVTFPTGNQDQNDLLVAMLSDEGFDGFEDAGKELYAYIDDTKFSAETTSAIAAAAGTNYTTEIIPAQNWNALWESNFQPVIIDDFCTIRAHFHDIEVTTKFDIVITPKMSFGTGHHATTRLMMLMMKALDTNGKTVLDFGTGTGILAILAEMLGATQILAIDNDAWSIENTIENVERNSCKHIAARLGSLEDIAFEQTDIILANINRHILIQYMQPLYERLINGGSILMSGLLVEDEPIIKEAATGAGFTFIEINEQNGWIALLFEKR
jgi:ribosomal protein L11 methyltransferase